MKWVESISITDMYSPVHFTMVRTLLFHFTDRERKAQNHQTRKWQSWGLNPEHSVSEAPTDSGLPTPEAGMGQSGQTCGACPAFCSPSGFWSRDSTEHPTWKALFPWHCPLTLASGYTTEADPQGPGLRPAQGLAGEASYLSQLSSRDPATLALLSCPLTPQKVGIFWEPPCPIQTRRRAQGKRTRFQSPAITSWMALGNASPL